MILTERLYLTEDKNSVVKEGDERAAFLLGVPGTKISDKEAKRLGLLAESQVNAVQFQEPEVSTQDIPITHRDGGNSPRRRGRPKA